MESEGESPHNNDNNVEVYCEPELDPCFNSSIGVVQHGPSAVESVRGLLNRRMLVGVNDGRFFLGNFYCVDKQGNIILHDTVEFRSVRRSVPSPMEQRGLGLILIPSHCRTSCHVDGGVEEQISKLSVSDL